MSHVIERFASFSDAILFGNEQDVRDYLQYGAKTEEIDEYAFTPLIEALIANKPEIVQILLEHKALVEFPDVSGRTPLFWAVDNYDLPMCKLLLTHKADPNAYTIASQPLLVNPILREQHRLKNLLQKHGASLTFAQDYINTKLIGHRFELNGNTTLLDHKGVMINLDFEGFFLEFTLGIIRQSLKRFIHHFLAKKLKDYFPYVKLVMRALSVSAELLKFQHHTVKIEKFQNQINRLLRFRPLIIPVGYAGHAITFIVYKNAFVKIDRGFLSHQEGSVVIYKIGNPAMLTGDFVKNLLYQLQPKHFVEKTYKEVLKLKPVLRLPLSSQSVGNCSWANVEAVVPTIMFLVMWGHNPKASTKQLEHFIVQSMEFYEAWSHWDKAVTLTECIRSFHDSDTVRKATKADILGAIIFHQCDYRKPEDIEWAEKIVPVLTLPEYDYVLKSYIDLYYNQEMTEEGKNLMHLLEICGASFEDWFDNKTHNEYE